MFAKTFAVANDVDRYDELENRFVAVQSLDWDLEQRRGEKE